MIVPNKTKMADLVNYRLRVTTVDGKQMVGQMLAFDRYMNLVLSDCEEFRATKKSLLEAKKTIQTENGDASSVSITEEKRTLGLVILRGETVVSVSVEAPPPTDPTARLGNTALTPGSGSAKGINRAIPTGPRGAGGPGLGGPVRSAPGGRAPPGFQAPPGFGRA
ncbi:YALIA101S12e00144g1_1 [Yarrowia lipolytica]|nr:YALIA101S12e00144g1_1 [Yarrowia lipolytica]VBB88068.1 Core Sm protein Sm B, putative [Yarrowia lipolytica]